MSLSRRFAAKITSENERSFGAECKRARCFRIGLELVSQKMLFRDTSSPVFANDRHLDLARIDQLIFDLLRDVFGQHFGVGI